MRAHSTRGTGVVLYKSFGLTTEQVCEIGKWKDVKAFSTHYLRLGAQEVASEKLKELVHNISPYRSAEPEVSRTPTRNPDGGGRDTKGVAQENGEILQFSCRRNV